ncbi:MAG: DUF4962 domain-containing protein [Armatimonadota bacterium]|jgi:hypothetical protein
MCARMTLTLCLTVSTLVGLSGLAVGQENMFLNPTFEQLDDDGQPEAWRPVNFNTGGESQVGTDGGRAGDNYAIMRGSGPDDRAAWRQHVEWDPEVRGVTIGGWYRSAGPEEAGRGASIRLLFNHTPGVWEHLDIQSAFFPPADEWTQVKMTYLVPEGTRDIVVELFHWFASGETHWDDVMIRPATEDELMENLLPPALAVDREPVPGRNVPYSPADGETVRLNPPPFLWLPSAEVNQHNQERWEQLPHNPASWSVHGEVTYRLQVSRGADFEAGDLVVDMSGLIYTAEMLTEPLEPGEYAWRYGVDIAEHPTIWSMARQFEVPEDAALWPYPDAASFVVADTRPRLLVPQERVEELRRRAAEGDLQDVAASLLNTVARHAGEELVVEPDYTPSTAPERGPAAVTIMRTTRPPMDVMESVAFAYLLTGDEAAGAEAKRRILHFFSWDPQGPTGYFGYDEPAMWVMMRGVRAYDWTYDLFTDEERALVEDSMRIRAADMYRMLRRMPFDNNPYSSHPGRTIGFLGEAAIAFYHEWEEAPEYLDYIARIYWGVYPAWGEDDGGWNEGPGYWNAYMSFALHFVLALREGTGIDLAQRPFFNNTPYYALYMTPPHGQTAPFGDGAEWRPRRHGSLIYWFSSLNRDPIIRWFAEESGAGPGSSVLGVLLKDDSIEPEAPVDLPTSRVFEGAGLVALRNDLVIGDNDVGFLMKSSPYGAVSHGHNAQNCFVLEAYGEALAVNTGHYNFYGSPHHTGWTHETKSKNGITFDGGQGQDRGWHARGAITDFIHSESFDLVIGDATEAYGGRLTRALREVVHVRPGLFVIRDDLASEEPRTFEYQLHAIDQMTLRPEANEVLITRPNASLTARFLEPAALEITQTDQYDPPPLWPEDRDFEDLWHTTASLTEARDEAEFLSVLMPARSGQERLLPATRHLVSETARGVELTFADGRRTVVGFALPGVTGPITLEDFSSDAHIFAVTIGADGTPGDVMVHAGTSLMHNAQELAGG